MEDTKSLLVMVLQKIFHDRPKVVEDTYQLIYNYNNGKREKSEYERTLKNICDLMNDELPSEILVYLLTLVDMPHEDGHQLPIMEKIQKTYSCLAESVRPSLLEYLANKKGEEKVIMNKQKDDSSKEKIKTVATTQIAIKELSAAPKDEQINKQHEANTSDDKFLKPATKRNKNKRKICKNITSESSDNNYEPVKSLLDITANYVIKNERRLKLMYKTKLAQAWKMINSNRYFGATLKQCYDALKDINKNAKLLRCIENDNITEDIFMEEYENSEILLKECNMFQVVNKDPFEVSDELMKGIKSVISD